MKSIHWLTLAIIVTLATIVFLNKDGLTELNLVFIAICLFLAMMASIKKRDEDAEKEEYINKKETF